MTRNEPRMPPFLSRSAVALAAVLVAGVLNSASAQDSAPLTYGEFTPKQLCDFYIWTYDRFGASRSENSDGSRHHVRIGACADCSYYHREQDGINAMIDLLQQKRFGVPKKLEDKPPSKDRVG